MIIGIGASMFLSEGQGIPTYLLTMGPSIVVLFLAGLFLTATLPRVIKDCGALCNGIRLRMRARAVRRPNQGLQGTL